MDSPRPFYLIANNPNSVEDAVKALTSGANALEPDVYFSGNDFYVVEPIPLWSKIFPPKKGLLLADYLTGLQTEIFTSQTTDNPLQLALILFDTKNLDQYIIDNLSEVIRTNFTLPNVRIAIIAGNKKFLYRFKAFSPKSLNEIVGIAGGCTAVNAYTFFRKAKIDFVYGNGTDLPLVSTLAQIYFDEIRAAIQLRDSGNTNSPSLVYAWTLNRKESMRGYLRLGVDGFVTDKITDALSVIAEAEFAGKIRLEFHETIEAL